MHEKVHMFGALIFYVMGVTLMMASDCQKTVILNNVKQRPILIANGLFSRTRNPNYLGESMLYLSLAVLTNHILSYCIVAFAISSIYSVRILQKELSLRQKAGFWDDYVNRSNILIPKIFGSWIDHIILLIFVGLAGKYILADSFVGYTEVK